MPSGKYIRSEETKERLRTLFKGKKHTQESKEKISKSETKEYKDIANRTIHDRFVKKHGRPKHCEHCKKTDKKIYEWSNKDHKYSENIEDWQRLCRGCHMKYDYKHNNRVKKCLKQQKN